MDAVDLDGDADHDGQITAADDAVEDQLPGVITLCNVDDDDDADGNKDNQGPEADTIDGASDGNDLIPVVLRAMPALPAGWSVSLALHSPSNVASGVGADDVVRVFSARAPGPNVTAILGPGTAGFTLPEDAPHNVDLTALRAGDITLGVEGLEFAGEVRLRMALQDPGGGPSCSDEIQLKVAPFILLPNTATPSRVIVSDASVPFVAGVVGLAPGASIIVNYPATDDVWPQDAWEFGFASWPGFAGAPQVMPTAMETVRAGRPLEAWGRTNLLGPVPADPEKTALIERQANLDDGYAYGGNLEVTPPMAPTYPLGRIVVGQQMPSVQKDFLTLQAVQTPLIELDVGWLRIGHIDEVLAFIGAPSGVPDWEVVFASPAKGFETIDDPSIPEYEPLFYGSPADSFEHGTATGGTSTTLVDSTADFTAPGAPQWKYVRIYDDGAPAGQQGTKGQVAEVTVTDGATLTLVRVWNLSNSTALYTALFGADAAPATGQTTWYANPDSTSKYIVVPSSKMWLTKADPFPEFPALVTVKELRNDPDLRDRNLGDQAAGIEGIQNKIDAIKQSLQPVLPGNVPFREIPALYLGTPNDPAKKGVAYVPGLVNLQVWGNDLWLPRPIGPRVGGIDKFEESADGVLKTGVRQTHYIKDWKYYHRKEGEVHCGTNVLRQLPSMPVDYKKWWEQIPE